MNRRWLVTWLLISLLAGAMFAMGFPVGTAAADHSEPTNSTEIVEVQTVTTEGTETGTLEVDISYHVGSEVRGFEVDLSRAQVDVLATDGFSHAGGETFEWDERTAEPVIRVERNADVERSRVPGLDFTETEDWALVDTLDTGLVWRAVDPERIEFSRLVQSPEPGVGGQEVVYIGDHETATFEASDETFTVVVSRHIDADVVPADVGDTLTESAEMLDVAGEAEELTAFVVGDPLRRGGLASPAGTDFWVHGDQLITARHEYVHTRQAYDRTDAVEWTLEAEADYFQYLLSLKQGDLQYHGFHQHLDGFDEEFGGVVLADPNTWRGTPADYRLGALVLAQLDTEIRAANEGTATYEAVLREKNLHDGTVTDADVEAIIDDVAGASMGEFLDEHARSTPGSLEVPPPTVYQGGNIRASLEITTPEVGAGSELALPRGESTTVRFEVTNDGSETALAPLLDARFPEDIAVTAVSAPELNRSITAVDDGWVLDHLELGASQTVVFEVSVSDAGQAERPLEATVTDMSGNEARISLALAVVEPPTLDVSVPESAIIGEEVTLAADVTGGSDVTVEWTADEFTRTGATVNVTFEETGIKTLVVTAEDERGLTATRELEIVVEEDHSSPVDDFGSGMGVGAVAVALVSLLILVRIRGQ